MQTEFEIEIPDTVKGVDFTVNESNPRVSRWGYNPASPNVRVSARETGVSGEMIPAGLPILFNTFTINVENCTMDIKKEFEVPFEVSALAATQRVGEILKDKGVKTFWAGEYDKDLVKKYWQICHPRLSQIGVYCPFNEEDDFEAREICPQCLYDWLSGNVPEGATEDFQSFEERLAEFADGKIIRIDRAEELRRIIREGNLEYLKSSQKEWNQLAGDYLAPDGRTKGFAAAQQYMRKNIHVLRPQDRELHKTAVLGEAMAERLNEAIAKQSNNQMDAGAIAQTVVATLVSLGVIAPPPAAKPDKQLEAKPKTNKTSESKSDSKPAENTPPEN